MTTAVTNIAFSPLLPWWVIGALAAVALLPILYGLLRRARGTVWRTGMLSLLLLALANPSLVEELREPERDVALVVVDDSASQRSRERAAQRDAALEDLNHRLPRHPNLDERVTRVGDL